MLRAIYTIALVVVIMPLTAQNLVPNASFETYSSCPNTYGQLDNVSPWNKPNAGSTDYFNGCAPSSSPVSVPSNYGGGYQQARTGQGYVGFTTYKESYPNYREYLQVELTQPLIASRCYFFEMYVNKKDSAKYITDRIGAHIRSGPKTGLSSTFLNVFAQIESPPGQMLDDSVAWVPVRGYYNATGGEDHLLIGNFHNDFGTSYSIQLAGSLQNYAFYYVDDVRLTELDFGLDLGPDTLLCSGQTLDLRINLPGAQYNWSDGSTTPERTITSPGIYSVTVTIGQCSPIIDTIKVSYIKAPRINFGGDTSICTGQPYTLDAGTPYANYLWQDGSIGPTFEVTEDGKYFVEVSNLCGLDSDTILIEYIECKNLLFVPNAFTPNGDGINDLFCLKGTGIEAMDLRIFDRWGQLVAQLNEPLSCWDGRKGSQQLPPGIYHWVAEYVGGGQTILQKEKRKTGFVYLLR